MKRPAVCGPCCSPERKLLVCRGFHLFDALDDAVCHLVVTTNRRIHLTDSLKDKAAQVCPVGVILVKRNGFAVPIGERRYDNAPIGERRYDNAPIGESVEPATEGR